MRTAWSCAVEATETAMIVVVAAAVAVALEVL